MPVSKVGRASRRVFLDVGAHIGETLQEAIEPRWGFDAIYSFEPVASNLQYLERFRDSRVELVPCGWWTSNTQMPIFQPGEIGASIHMEKSNTSASELCSFIDAAEWLRANTAATDQIWLKLNCEGAECDIIDRLHELGMLERIDHLLVHFDVEKVPGQEARADPARALLAQAGVEVCEAKEIMFGRSHAAKTANWLQWTEAGPVGRFIHRHPVRWSYRVRQRLYPLKVLVKARFSRSAAGDP